MNTCQTDGGENPNSTKPFFQFIHSSQHFIALSLTWSPVSLLHPDVAVALRHTSLRVKERHSDAPLCAEPSVVVVTLLQGISVALLSQTDTTGPEAK